MDNLDYFENVRNRLKSILKISNNLQKQVQPPTFASLAKN